MFDENEVNMFISDGLFLFFSFSFMKTACRGGMVFSNNACWFIISLLIGNIWLNWHHHDSYLTAEAVTLHVKLIMTMIMSFSVSFH